MSREQRKFKHLLNTVQRVAMRVLALALSALFLSQAFITSPLFRRPSARVVDGVDLALPAARRIDPVPDFADTLYGQISITSQNGPNAKAVVLVNGEEVANFADGTVGVRVRAGDLVEIDGGISSQPEVFVVAEVSPQMIEPRIGDKITTQNSVEIVARVRIE